MPPRSSAREQTSPGPASTAAGRRGVWTFARPAPGGGVPWQGRWIGNVVYCASRPGRPEVNAGGRCGPPSFVICAQCESDRW
eukprot:scaffold141466_cov133-Phaeocystis_antarctica.AAC.1